jgi:molybdopterin-guanine dinucleotide biosynthesis protein A
MILAEGAALAGGQSRRMGQDKAALAIGGQPLLARVVARLQMVTPQVRVIGAVERAALVPGVPVVPDLRPGCGPLGGIYTALRTTSAPYVLVVGCDMPFLNAALLRHLLFDPAGLSTMNVNTAAEWQRALALLNARAGIDSA